MHIFSCKTCFKNFNITLYFKTTKYLFANTVLYVVYITVNV